MSMNLFTPFIKTFMVLLTPLYPLSDSTPTDSSPFSKANLAIKI